MQPIISPRPRAEIGRIDARDGERRDPFQPSFRSSFAGQACRGVQLLQGMVQPGELAEGFFPSHVLVVNVGGPIAYENWWSGRGWKAAAAPRHGVHLFPAGMPYAARWGQSVEALILEIAPSFVAAVAGAEIPLRPLELDPAATAVDPVLAHAALAIAEEVRAGAPGGRLCTESLATALVARLLWRRTAHLAASRRALLSRPRLDRVLDYISEHLAHGISLRDLAALAEMDVFAFVRAFKQTTGLPPHQYLLRARVERAKALLRDGSLSISDVALATGFATPSHFATTFRRLTRATPRAFRDSHA